MLSTKDRYWTTHTWSYAPVSFYFILFFFFSSSEVGYPQSWLLKEADLFSYISLASCVNRTVHSKRVTPKDCRCILNRIKNVHSYTMGENSSSSTVVGEISSVNSITSAATLENGGLSTPSTSATPKGGVKRVFTPSPELFYMKSRQIAGDMAAENKGEDIGMEVGPGSGPGSSYVSVSLPLDADDVAAHLKDVMLPEIQNMIQQQIVVGQAASIAEIVDKAIGKADKSINDTLMKEINAVKIENDKLRSENSDLRKSVDKLT